MHPLYTTALKLAERVVERYSEKAMTLATAESCTGGLVGHLITEVSGSSACFVGGIIAYANEIKHHALGVPQEVIDLEGAVSAAVAKAMAEGARERLVVDVAISITGIAGPTGGTPEKPVGTVYMAIATACETRVEHYCWNNDRSGNKLESAIAALGLILDAASK